MQKFLLIIKGYPANWNKVPESEKLQIYPKYGAYSQQLKNENKLIIGDAVNQSGLKITANAGQVEASTTLADTDLAATGLYMFWAENMSEATEIAKKCPALSHGDFVELYQMAQIG